jgi:glycerol dehydrogenase
VLPGFEEKWLHGNVVAYGVLVQLLIDGDVDEARRLKAFMQELEIPTTLREMDVPVDRTVLQPVLTETVTGPDMEHIPYPITEDMVFEAMVQVEML